MATSTQTIGHIDKPKEHTMNINKEPTKVEDETTKSKDETTKVEDEQTKVKDKPHNKPFWTDEPISENNICWLCFKDHSKMTCMAYLMAYSRERGIEKRRRENPNLNHRALLNLFEENPT